MPANLTPDYKAAEAEFRKARTPEDKLRHLREMLRLVPKHKGTDHLQADIKTRIKELNEELAGPKKGGARTGPPTSVRPDGAAQVALVGPPNTGKSALHDRLTGSHAATGPYPFTTQFAQPGMLPVGDVNIQLVDLPPVASQHPVPWLANSLRPADGCLLVVDLGDPGCVEDVAEVHSMLAQRRIVLSESWEPGWEDPDDPFAQRLPVLLVANKADEIPAVDEQLAVFEDLGGYGYEAVCVSAATGAGLDAIGRFLFSHLGIVRVYSKLPGQPPDLDSPFTLRSGQTVADMAALVHKELAERVNFARLWRGGHEKGHVGRDHHLEDGDVVELHVH